jgi:hypothetical protein
MMEKETKPLTFYHLGKVVKVINKTNSKNFDKKPKIVSEMWDSNVVTCELGSADVKDGDYVVILFNGILQSQNIFMQPVAVTDVLSKEAGQEVWDKYKSFMDKSKPVHPFTG